MKPLGEAASELPWLMPNAVSLIALTQPEPAWEQISRDPAAVLLVLRGAGVSRNDKPANDKLSTSQLCARPVVLETALRHMERDQVHPIPWDQPGCDVVYRHCLETAMLARSLATKLPRCDAEQAWIAGLLAPLGWLAVCAADSERIAQELRAFAEAGHHGGWQHQAWGLDHAALVRRLSRVWELPAWLANVIGHLGLPVDIAVRLGAEPCLFQVVQLALALRQRDERGLALPLGADVEELLSSLDLSDHDAEEVCRRPAANLPKFARVKKRRLLMELLRSALAARRLGNAPPAGIFGFEPSAPAREIHLGSELQVLKMDALAELAAGAGHEINNPLAVISGQAQYIARQLEQAQLLVPEEPVLAEYLTALQTGIQQSLTTIRGQTRRIHQVLVNLMQFARPSSPQPRIVSVRELLREAVAAVEDLARLKKVRLTCPDVPDTWRLQIDRGQTVAALTCLLRNAVESAPADGWARLRAEQTGDKLKLSIEDNGPGPVGHVLEHMFDPFYSGRSAGRGQGLGLPIAWRLARQQGGDVWFDGHGDGATRFVLCLPGLESGYRAPDANGHALEQVLESAVLSSA